MALISDDRRAVTETPILDHLAERWSPRSFDPAAVIGDEELTALLEAARWAPSAANLQPRRFIAVRRGTVPFDAVTASLAEGNQPWAPNASLYIVAIALTQNAEGAPMRWAEYDAGQAMAHLTVQAHALGLHVHPIGGFDPAAIRATFDLPETAVPVTVSAIGTAATADALPDRYRERELAPRTRLPLSELVLVRE